MFDYQQLRRFEIPFNRLPDQSLIVNEPKGLYYRYKTLIWSLGAAFLVLFGFIIVLLVNIRQRKRAQQGLQDILVAMASVLKVGSAAEIKGCLVETINRVIFLDKAVQRVGLFNYAGPLNTFDETKLIALPWSGQPLDATDSHDEDRAIPLIREAVEVAGSVVNEHECVALFKTNSIKANVVYLRGGRRFEEMDRDLLEILTNNVAMAMENLERSKMQESLETAKKIQLSMLPHDFRRLAQPFAVDLCARLVPANEVGGDLYDVHDIDSDHLLVAVGDVADKGVPAALFMAMSKTLIRAEAERSRNPAEILCKVNNDLARENSQCLFVTLFLAVLDRRSRVLRYANGGHNPPYVVRSDGSVEPLPILQSPALGIIENAVYQEQSIQLDTGDALFAYSDGVTEAENSASEMFGEARLEAALQGSIGVAAVDFTGGLLAELETFARGAGQADDITMLLLRMD
jgi:serine phosphatase RsbU (regulator of sigma subunit)